MIASHPRHRAAIALCVLAAVMSACSDGRTNGTMGRPSPLASQDRLPLRATALDKAVVPLASAARHRVDIHETVTRGGEPLRLGSIDLPRDWSVVESIDRLPVPCDSWQPCVLWEAVSADGSSRILLLSPRRDYVDAAGDKASASTRIASQWLRDPDADQGAKEAGAEVVALEPARPPTRSGWSTAGAWLATTYDAFDVPMRELRALDIEARHEGGKRYRVQSWPMLVLRMPAERYDPGAAEAVRRSLQFEPDGVAAWWLGWESRTIHGQCTLGYQRGQCHVKAGPYTDYFRSGDSLGLWDTRTDSAYGEPAEQQYDPGSRRVRR